MNRTSENSKDVKEKKSGKSENDVRRFGDCETCMYFYYDEEFEEDVCHADLDEDEMSAAVFSRRGCPSYRYYDEYVSVRRQN